MHVKSQKNNIRATPTIFERQFTSLAAKWDVRSNLIDSHGYLDTFPKYLSNYKNEQINEQIHNPWQNNMAFFMKYTGF